MTAREAPESGLAFVAQAHRCAYCGLLPCQCPDLDAPLPGEPVGEWTEIGTTDGD